MRPKGRFTMIAELKRKLDHRLWRHAPDKQGNNRGGFVAVIGLTLLKRSPISGLDQVLEQSGIHALWRASPEIPSETTLFVSHLTGAAELRGRTSEFPLECTVERRFRGIADLGRNLEDVRIRRH
jgi:hypothetical protein